MRHLRTDAIQRRARRTGVALFGTSSVVPGLLAAGITPVHAGPPASERRWLCAAAFRRLVLRSFTLVFVLLLATVSVARAEDRTAPRQNLPLPHIVLFVDYFLFAAQKDVYAMSKTERSALAVLLDSCPDMLIAGKIKHLKCDLARYRYLIKFRQDRHVDDLLDAMQFMSNQFRYNQIIGRGNQIGIDRRLGVIHASLRSALRFAAAQTNGG